MVQFTCTAAPSNGVIASVGCSIWFSGGSSVGSDAFLVVFSAERSSVGSSVGCSEGSAVGSLIGCSEGFAVGPSVGCSKGSSVGWSVGNVLGSRVGSCGGLRVGRRVSEQCRWRTAGLKAGDRFARDGSRGGEPGAGLAGTGLRRSGRR